MLNISDNEWKATRNLTLIKYKFAKCFKYSIYHVSVLFYCKPDLSVTIILHN